MEQAARLTFVSDMSLALICVLLVLRVRTTSLAQPYRFSFWFFLLLGMSTAVGGVAHLLDHMLGPGAHYLAWSINGMSVTVAEFGAISLVTRPRAQRALMSFAVARYTGLLFVVVTTGRFLWVGVHAAVGFVAVISTIHVLETLRSGNRALLHVPIATATMLVPAATHAFNVHIGTVINKNVVSHLLLIPSLFLLGDAFGRRFYSELNCRSNHSRAIVSCSNQTASEKPRKA